MWIYLSFDKFKEQLQNHIKSEANRVDVLFQAMSCRVSANAAWDLNLDSWRESYRELDSDESEEDDE